MTLDDWDQYTFEFVRSIGNAGANEFLEHNEAYVVWQGLGKGRCWRWKFLTLVLPGAD